MNQLTEFIAAQKRPPLKFHPMALALDSRLPWVTFAYKLPQDDFDRSMRQLAAWWTMDHSVIAPHEAALSRLDAR